MKHLNKIEAEFVNAKSLKISTDIPSSSITINTSKISIYDKTLDLIIDLSNIDLNKIESIIINGVTFTNESKEEQGE